MDEYLEKLEITVRKLMKQHPIIGFGQDVYIDNGEIYQRLDDKQLLTLLWPHLACFDFEAVQNPNFLHDIKGYIRRECWDKVSDLVDELRYHLTLENGVLNVKEKILEDMVPPVLSGVPVARNFNLRVVKASWNGYRPCPVFDRLIQELSGENPEYEENLLQALSCMIVAPYNVNNYIFCFAGTGKWEMRLLADLVASFYDPKEISSVDILEESIDKLRKLQWSSGLNVCWKAEDPLQEDATLDEGQEERLRIMAQESYDECLKNIAIPEFTMLTPLLCWEGDPPVESLEPRLARHMIVRYVEELNYNDPNLPELLRMEKDGILYRLLVVYEELLKHDMMLPEEDEFFAGFWDT